MFPFPNHLFSKITQNVFRERSPTKSQIMRRSRKSATSLCVEHRFLFCLFVSFCFSFLCDQLIIGASEPRTYYSCFFPSCLQHHLVVNRRAESKKHNKTSFRSTRLKDQQNCWDEIWSYFGFRLMDKSPPGWHHSITPAILTTRPQQNFFWPLEQR